MYVILQEWDAIELFSRVIAKFESRDISEFDNARITTCLRKYSSKNEHEAVARSVFGVDAKGYPVKSKTFYEFVRRISHSLPVELPIDAFTQLCTYINQQDFAVNRYKTSKTILLSTKQRLLEETKWWIYFYDRRKASLVGKSNGEEGISKGLLEMLPFGKSKLTRLRDDDKTYRVYSGTFKTYRNEEYLAFKMRMEPNLERDLRMSFYIGSDVAFTLALGLSANVSDTDYTRIVVIEPIKEKGSLQKALGYSSFTAPNNKVKIPDYIKEFLSDKTKAKNEVPSKITSPEKLMAWSKEAKAR